MEVYQVGGAVRDDLLGDPVNDRDWVVVGASEEAMLALGYRRVGRDFPVFLHPQTHEEYALARTERKSGRGYRGFEVHADGAVTLEQDLERRDLTINAIARDTKGTLIDPFGGRADLDQRLLRHVSPAFAEDPVRILRVARFMARYADRGFTVAEQTLALMGEMVETGEVDHLVAERVWAELVKALAAPRPDAFVSTLRQCGALARILPEVDVLFGVPQPAEYHPEIDTGDHVLATLRAAATEAAPVEVVFACLVHDLGKGLTPRAEWPSHRGHEQAGIEPVGQVCERLRVPRAFRDLALRVCREHLRCHRALEMRPGSVYKLIQAVDGLRQPEAFDAFLQACRCDLRGRLGREDEAYPQADFLRQARDAAATVPVAELRQRGLDGSALGRALDQARIKAIKDLSRD